MFRFKILLAVIIFFILVLICLFVIEFSFFKPKIYLHYNKDVYRIQVEYNKKNQPVKKVVIEDKNKINKIINDLNKIKLVESKVELDTSKYSYTTIFLFSNENYNKVSTIEGADTIIISNGHLYFTYYVIDNSYDSYIIYSSYDSSNEFLKLIN